MPSSTPNRPFDWVENGYLFSQLPTMWFISANLDGGIEPENKGGGGRFWVKNVEVGRPQPPEAARGGRPSWTGAVTARAARS